MKKKDTPDYYHDLKKAIDYAFDKKLKRTNSNIILVIMTIISSLAAVTGVWYSIEHGNRQIEIALNKPKQDAIKAYVKTEMEIALAKAKETESYCELLESLFFIESDNDMLPRPLPNNSLSKKIAENLHVFINGDSLKNSGSVDTNKVIRIIKDIEEIDKIDMVLAFTNDNDESGVSKVYDIFYEYKELVSMRRNMTESLIFAIMNPTFHNYDEILIQKATQDVSKILDMYLIKMIIYSERVILDIESFLEKYY